MSGIDGDNTVYPFAKRGRLVARGLSIALTLLLCVPLSQAETATTPSTQAETPAFSQITQLRAAFAFNALKFTIWPEQLISDSARVRVVLVGEDDVSRLLASKLPDYTVHGKPIEIIRAVDMQQDAVGTLLQDAHAIYFASDSRRRDYPALLASLDAPALTISSIDGFASNGGMVEITLKENRSQLELRINRGNLAQANVALSSALMKISRIVD